MGLAPYQINTFTNHILNKLNSAYQSEADREVSTSSIQNYFYFLVLTLLTYTTTYFLQANHVMSGFQKSKPYFVPESQLPLPETVEF